MEKESSLPVEVQPFRVVDDYTTFSVEYTVKRGNDYHFHFFVTPEMAPRGDLYWQGTFPEALNKVAMAHFGFERPRLEAAIVRGVLRYGQSEEEKPQDSWWMVAQNIIVPDPEMLISQLFEKLDQELTNSMMTAVR